MPVLYVTQVGSELRKRDERCAVEYQGQTVASLPLRDLERIVMLGPSQLSAGLSKVLLEKNIPVFFCSSHGRCHGSLAPGNQGVELLLAQVERHNNPDYALQIAQNIVQSKITHQQRLLKRHHRNHPNSLLDNAAGEIERLGRQVEQTADVPETMGLEGQASAVYFGVFGVCLRQKGIQFKGRSRRPAQDEVNATLNFAYMLMLPEVQGALMAQGLHPGLGFLHVTTARHAALSLDVLELVRQPIADRLVLSLFNRGAFKPDDFNLTDNGVRFKEATLKRFLEFYERMVTIPFQFKGQTATLRGYIHAQAENLKKAIRSGIPWQPELLEL